MIAHPVSCFILTFQDKETASPSRFSILLFDLFGRHSTAPRLTQVPLIREVKVGYHLLVLDRNIQQAESSLLFPFSTS